MQKRLLKIKIICVLVVTAILCFVPFSLTYRNKHMVDGFQSGMTEEEILFFLKGRGIRFSLKEDKVENDWPGAGVWSPKWIHFSTFTLKRYCLLNECGSLKLDLRKSDGLYGVSLCKTKPIDTSFLRRAEEQTGRQKNAFRKIRVEAFRDFNGDHCIGWRDPSL